MTNRTSSGKHIFLIGPGGVGGVGKTSHGPGLVAKSGFGLIDLDQECCDRIKNIGTFIDTKGYLARA